MSTRVRLQVSVVSLQARTLICHPSSVTRPSYLSADSSFCRFASLCVTTSPREILVTEFFCVVVALQWAWDDYEEEVRLRNSRHLLATVATVGLAEVARRSEVVTGFIVVQSLASKRREAMPDHSGSLSVLKLRMIAIRLGQKDGWAER